MAMIEVVAKTKWHGLIALRHQHLKQAQEQQQSLLVIHDGGQMIIPWQEVYSRAVSRSEYQVLDKYGKLPPGYLYYYNWVPESVQESLF